MRIRVDPNSSLLIIYMDVFPIYPFTSWNSQTGPQQERHTLFGMWTYFTATLTFEIVPLSVTQCRWSRLFLIIYIPIRASELIL